MCQPPIGTFTFLFTDLEGSTRLWERHPDAMRPALARHDALLRASIEGRGGYIFKTVGDAFCAALVAEPWPEGITLRARMALHAGAAEHRDGDYFGPPLNRVARLLSAGHGGQVLLSRTAFALACDQLPDGAGLQDLGEHPLRGLEECPEHVFQLLHLGLPADFPPLRSLRVAHLPVRPARLIGREKEMAEVKRLLAGTRLLTLTGPGGTGKTSLSYQVAVDLLSEFPDGVWGAELAPVSDPALVPQAVAGALGVPDQPGRPPVQTLIDSLRSRTLLLVLDNCEHLLSACAVLVDDLIRHCPALKILASSREAFNILGEQTYRVPSLSLPDPEQGQTAETLLQYGAVLLFVARAQAVQSDFQLTDANAQAVAQVCWRLDGIPLAIELAAARVRALSVEEVRNKLDNLFLLLTGGYRTALPRQQTLRAAISWSYDLLSVEEKTLLGRLSVFAGGWSLEAAEAVCAGGPVAGGEVLSLLTSLVDKNLVVREEKSWVSRYHLLEMMHQYGREKLAQSGEAEAVRVRHRDAYLQRAEEAEPHLREAAGPAWFDILEVEHENLRAALDWCRADPAGAQTGLRLAAALWRFWETRGHLSEGRRWYRAILNREGADAPTAARADALNGAGNLAREQGDLDAAQALQKESLAIRRSLRDDRGVAASLNNLGVVARLRGRPAKAAALFRLAERIFLRLGDVRSRALALSNQGLAARDMEDPDAWRFHQQSLELRRELGDLTGIAVDLEELGRAAYARNDIGDAYPLLRESAAIRRRMGDQRGMVYWLETVADLEMTLGRPERAATLLAAAEAGRARLGVPVKPASLERREALRAAIRARLGASNFASATTAGRAMTPERAIDFALS